MSPPENQPFEIHPFASMKDPRTAANGDVTAGWTHAQRHEQFPAKLVIDVANGFVLDLDGPRQNDLLANVVLTTARGDGAPSDGTATVTDWNDAGGWPQNGVHRWKVTIRVELLTIECPAFAERMPDGHYQVRFDVCQDLVNLAQPADVSILKFEATFLGKVAGKAFVTNPHVASPPSYRGFFEVTSRQNRVEREPFDLDIVNRVPDQVVVTPQAASRRAGATHTLTATVSDLHQGGDTLPVAGATVDFDVTSGPHAGALCTGVVADSAGRASCTYTGQAHGNDTVRAIATKHGVSAFGEATVDWDVPGGVTLAPSQATAFVGGSHSVTATVVDDDGTPMAGEQVAFEVTDGPHAGRMGSGTSDSNGRASFSYPGSAEGTDTIRASVGAVSGTASVTWQPAPTVQPASVNMSPSRYIDRRIGRDKATFHAFVQDDRSRFMEGITVRFSVISGPNAGDVEAEIVTDQSGVARWEYIGTAENGPGEDTVEARVKGTGITDTSTVVWRDASQPPPGCENPQLDGPIRVCVG